MSKAIQFVFKRYEKKYLVPSDRLEELQSRLAEHMKSDDYGKYTISNIYFDTDCFDLIRTSIEKPIYKEKLRIRSYGQVTDDGNVFVEIKKKFDGIVYKRRIEMPWRQAKACYVTGEAKELPTDTQIEREINWFMQYYKPEPKVFLAYDRTALSGIENSELRMTFDSNIRWRGDRLDLGCATDGESLLPKNTVLMEIKIPGTAPVWLAHILSEMELFPASFSKYGSCYKNELATQWLPAANAGILSLKNNTKSGVKLYA